MMGELLQELRKDRGISQAELADYLGVTHYTVSSYECNRSDPDDRIKVLLAGYFDVSLDYLLGLIDEPLSYKRNNGTISVPKNFDDADVGELKNYIEFITFKKGQK